MQPDRTRDKGYVEKTRLIEEAIELQQKVNRTLRQQVSTPWMKLSLTIAQLKSLFFISGEGSTCVGRLAAALGVTPANITGIIDRLVEHGLVSRTEDPQDRRMALLQVTPKGQALLADLHERQINHLSEIFIRMSPEELSTLVQGLSVLLRACELYQKETRK